MSKNIFLVPDPEINKAIIALAIARTAFKEAVKGKLILGNDNHIGDIGEYWARKYYEANNEFEAYGKGKVCPYDIKLKNGKLVSVKTITSWSNTGYGTQIVPKDGGWTVLVAVKLNENLHPEKMALITLEELLTKKVFKDNAEKRQAGKSKQYPRFQWWEWLDNYLVYSSPKAPSEST